MGTVVFNRPKRATPPPMPRGDLLLESPPEIPAPQPRGGFGAILRMLPMVAGAGAMAFMVIGGGMGGSRGPLGAIMGGMYAVSMLGMMMTQTGRGNDEAALQLDAARRDYFRYLGQTRRKVRTAAEAQRRAVQWRHPDPATLWTLAGTRRMWERRPDADDFGSVRISVGPQQFAQRITPPEAKPVEDLEPLTTGALRRFIRTHRTVPHVPLALSLKGFSHILLVGDREASRRLAYAMVAQAAAWHAPSDLRLVVAAGGDAEQAWAWAKWLPHLQHPVRSDGAGEARLFATSVTELADLADMSGAPQRPDHVVVVIDGLDGASGQSLAAAGGVTTVEISAQTTVPRRIETGWAVLEVTKDSLVLHRRQASGQLARTGLGSPDQVPLVYAEMLARQLAPYRAPVAAATGAVEEDEGPAVVFEPPKDYPSMVGVGDPLTLDVRQAWKLRPMSQRLRVPFGTGEDGRPVELDIKEAALGGMGPHGLCIGATGSGKSELLRTLVLGLAMTHSSEVLNFVLVDFKGGATFLGLDALPHTSAVITNLEGEITLVDRMQDAIAGELDRRMEVLRAAGNFKNREDYEAARLAGQALAPMPSLFIVVDEFSELLAARPEFIELFIQIGRIGRSIGVHLLLASQRLEEGKLRGLDTFLSYRIALRTFSPSESRVVIGVPDAYELPTPPGNGYLKYDTSSMVRFKAAYVSGPWQPSGQPARPSARPALGEEAGSTHAWVPPVLVFEAGHVAPVLPPEPDEPLPASLDEVPTTVDPVAGSAAEDEDEDDETLLSIVVGRLAGKGMPAHQVWLPPLDVPPTAEQLLPAPLREIEGRGLQVDDARLHGSLRSAVALIDRPRQQRRDPLWLDFSGAAGNLGVVGGPQSGKSTALRAVIAGLALTHTPDEVGFYCLDFGGGSLAGLREMPHVGSVCGRLDVDRVRRTVAELTSLLTAREIAFAELGVDGIAAYRRGRRDGSIPRDRFATDVFLVVDNWLTLRQEFEDQEGAITQLAARGLGFGIHVLLATSKWSEFRTNIRDLLLSRVELKLGDSFESEINRKLQALVPADRPGRGLQADGLHFLVALPRIDGVGDPATAPQGQRAMVTAMAQAWHGPEAAEVRMLPDMLHYSELPHVARDGVSRTIPFGIDELELAPVYLDPVADPHLVVFGGPESGKSSLLRTICAGIMQRYTPREAKILILDYRRSLLGFVEGEYLLGYAASSAAAEQMITDTAAAIAKRLPGPDVTQQQLRDRSWWRGAEVFVVVDDYELVATSSGNVLDPLSRLVSQASDVGFHLVLARGMGGAGRTAYGDRIIGGIKDGANPALIMSGPRDEGVLWGDTRPALLPPGRGTLVTRTGKVLVQTAFHPPQD